MERKNIVDLGELEKPIKAIRELLSNYNQVESDLIVTQLVAHRKHEESLRKQRDAMTNIPIKDLMQQIFKAEQGRINGDNAEE